MRLERFEGCWTAMVTPFNRKGEVDFEGLEKNVRFRRREWVKPRPHRDDGRITHFRLKRT